MPAENYNLDDIEIFTIIAALRTYQDNVPENERELCNDGLEALVEELNSADSVSVTVDYARDYRV